MKFAAAAVVLCVACASAPAAIIFTLGNNPQQDETNILFSGGSGTTVTGTPNGFPGVIVDFTSTQDLFAPASGQARVAGNPEGTPVTNLTISLEGGGTYGDLILNPFIGGCKDCLGGTATVTVNAKLNGVPELPSVFTYDIGNGNNFLTIVANQGESIVSTSISVDGGFNDLRQPRISGLLAQIPEPETYAMMALGLGLVGLARKRRKPATLR